MVRPHRAQLDRAWVDRLAGVLGTFSGVAVAYEPGTGFVLIGGEHRLAAHRLRGDQWIDVYMLRAWGDLVAWMINDQTFGKRYTQKPWSAVDAAYLYDKAVPLLKPARAEKAGDDIAEYAGVNAEAVRSVRYVVRLIEDRDEPEELRRYATEQLQLVVRGELQGYSIQGRLKTYREQLERKQAGAAAFMPANQQRSTLDNMGSLLTGLADTLRALGPINPELTPAEAAGWLGQIDDAWLQLFRLKRQLRERAGEGPNQS